MVSGGYAHVFTLSYGVRQEVAVYGSLIFMVIGTGRRDATGRRGVDRSAGDEAGVAGATAEERSRRWLGS